MNHIFLEQDIKTASEYIVTELNPGISLNILDNKDLRP